MLTMMVRRGEDQVKHELMTRTITPTTKMMIVLRTVLTMKTQKVSLKGSTMTLIVALGKTGMLKLVLI